MQRALGQNPTDHPRKDRLRRRVFGRTRTLMGCLAAAALVAVPTPFAEAQPPTGKTFFLLLLGASEPYAVNFGCSAFTDEEVCTEAGCGTWRWFDEDNPGGRFLLEIDDIEGDELTFRLEADLLVERRGRKTSIGGTGLIIDQESGRRFNFGLAGRQASRARCRILDEEFDDLFD